jgi:hypothetical protein
MAPPVTVEMAKGFRLDLPKAPLSGRVAVDVQALSWRAIKVRYRGGPP